MIIKKLMLLVAMMFATTQLFAYVVSWTWDAPSVAQLGDTPDMTWEFVLFVDGGDGVVGVGGELYDASGNLQGDDTVVSVAQTDLVIGAQYAWNPEPADLTAGTQVFAVAYNGTFAAADSYNLLSGGLVLVPADPSPSPAPNLVVGNATGDSWQPIPIPEPGTMALAILGVGAFVTKLRRRKK